MYYEGKNAGTVLRQANLSESHIRVKVTIYLKIMIISSKKFTRLLNKLEFS